mmetsp:Transcript_25946/g.52895  ORF Transcript_25946/g.52895 Transcript_25946/m.52895 type:complete len:235 (-) Transcript_25946:61-765(-)
MSHLRRSAAFLGVSLHNLVVEFTVWDVIVARLPTPHTITANANATPENQQNANTGYDPGPRGCSCEPQSRSAHEQHKNSCVFRRLRKEVYAQFSELDVNTSRIELNIHHSLSRFLLNDFFLVLPNVWCKVNDLSIIKLQQTPPQLAGVLAFHFPNLCFVTVHHHDHFLYVVRCADHSTPQYANLVTGYIIIVCGRMAVVCPVIRDSPDIHILLPAFVVCRDPLYVHHMMKTCYA